MKEHVLVIFPHPDDEAFSVSGTIASYREKGVPVTYICLTLGEMGRNFGKPAFANRETLPELRKHELEEACRVLDIQDLRRFGLRDKTVEFEPQEELVRRIREVMEEVNPTLVITFYPGYSVHPDHDACGEAVVKAVESLPKESRPTVHCIAFSKNCLEELGEPDVLRDVNTMIPKKIAAIKAHRSQTSNFAGEMEKKAANQDPEMLNRLGHERFWTYPLNK